MKRINGVHYTAEWYECNSVALLKDKLKLEDVCKRAVGVSGLKEVGSTFVSFGENMGVTGTVLLAESHLAIHTWPELSAVTVDVYVCNFNEDNSEKAKALMGELEAIFSPGRINQRELIRGDSSRREECVAPGYGVIIDIDAVLESGETEFQKYEFVKTKEFGVALLLDGCWMASERDEHTYHNAITKADMNIPVERVLLIGGGDGGCAKKVMDVFEPKELEWVEIDEQVAMLSKKWLSKINEGVFDDDRVKISFCGGEIAIEDALKANIKYDMIILDLTDPVVNGSEGLAFSLHTEEIYKKCAELLNDGGVLQLHAGSTFFHKEQITESKNRLEKIFKRVSQNNVFVPISGSEWAFMSCER